MTIDAQAIDEPSATASGVAFSPYATPAQIDASFALGEHIASPAYRRACLIVAGTYVASASLAIGVEHETGTVTTGLLAWLLGALYVGASQSRPLFAMLTLWSALPTIVIDLLFFPSEEFFGAYTPAMIIIESIRVAACAALAVPMIRPIGTLRGWWSVRDLLGSRLWSLPGYLLGYPRAHWVGGVRASWAVTVNWLLVSGLVGVLLEQAARESASRDAPSAWTLLAYGVASMLVYSWGAVGAWRACTRIRRPFVRRTMGWTAKAVVAAFTAAIAYLALVEHARFASWPDVVVRAFGIAKMPAATLTVWTDGRGATLSGRLGLGSARKLTWLLDAYPNVDTLRLASGGGSISEGARVADVVKQRSLDTHVRSRCSACCAHRTIRCGIHRM